MSYLNSITLVGFVGSDPEQRQAKGNGSKFTVLSIATQRSWKNADDEWSSKTEWHRIRVFRLQLAEYIATARVQELIFVIPRPVLRPLEGQVI
jgi:single stranded DNA-binding protein